MHKHDVQTRADLEQIVTNFYEVMLEDPIVGFIFTDIAKVDLASHLPIIVDFWSDIVLRKPADSNRTVSAKLYHGNALRKHVELSEKLSLKPGHFTRWLYLFTNAVRKDYKGSNADMMIERAELVAQSISAAIHDQKKKEMDLVLSRK